MVCGAVGSTPSHPRTGHRSRRKEPPARAPASPPQARAPQATRPTQGPAPLKHRINEGRPHRRALPHPGRLTGIDKVHLQPQMTEHRKDPAHLRPRTLPPLKTHQPLPRHPCPGRKLGLRHPPPLAGRTNLRAKTRKRPDHRHHPTPRLASPNTTAHKPNVSVRRQTPDVHEPRHLCVRRGKWRAIARPPCRRASTPSVDPCLACRRGTRARPLAGPARPNKRRTTGDPGLRPPRAWPLRLCWSVRRFTATPGSFLA